MFHKNKKVTVDPKDELLWKLYPPTQIKAVIMEHSLLFNFLAFFETPLGVKKAKSKIFKAKLHPL
jgi:hypothetical protein